MNERALWAQPRREERWYADLLDRDLNTIGPLSGFEGGSLELGSQMSFGGNATLNLVDRGQEIDWLSHSVRIWYDPGIERINPLAMATMRFVSPRESHKTRGLTRQVALLGRTSLLSYSPAGSYSLGVGTRYTVAIEALLREAVPGARIAITHSDLTLQTPYFAEPGSSYLKIINELLSACGYWSLWCDPYGQYRVEPYENPGSRTAAWDFQRGEYQLHVDEWEYERDLSSIPNRVKLIQQGTDDAPGLEAVADLPDSSPYSAASRGVVEELRETAEFATQAIGDQMAMTKLRDRLSPVGAIKVTHAILPLNPNDVVLFDGKDRRLRASVLRVSYQMRAGALASGEWREVFADG